MPSSTPERRARWKDDQTVIQYLEGKGYVLTRQWEWRKPSADHDPTDEEWDAIIYLIEEWDFGGLEIKRDDYPTRAGGTTHD